MKKKSIISNYLERTTQLNKFISSNPHPEKRPLSSQATFGTIVESKQPVLLTTAQLTHPPEALLALVCFHLALKVVMDPST